MFLIIANTDNTVCCCCWWWWYPLGKSHQEWRKGPGVSADQRWNFWPALPIAPYERRLTKRYEVVPGGVFLDEEMPWNAPIFVARHNDSLRF